MPRCDQCEVLCINGVNCHETGCPNSWKDPATGKPLPRECADCGQDFRPVDDGRLPPQVQHYCADCQYGG